MTKTEQARQIILRRFPCQELPGGALTDIANELGCTRELVRQAANSIGVTGTRGRRVVDHRLCSSCGYDMGHRAQADLCKKCRYITVNCAHCDAPVKTLASLLVWYVASGRYSGMKFCNRACMAAYRHEHNLGRPRNPNLPHGTPGMYGRGCRCDECRGYWKKYAKKKEVVG